MKWQAILQFYSKEKSESFLQNEEDSMHELQHDEA